MTENQNLYARFDQSFAKVPDTPALVDAGGSGPTFSELSRLSAGFARVLSDEGVAIDDRVVVQVEKSVGAVALYLACLRIGAIYVPLNTAYTAAEVDYFLGDADPSVFVCSAIEGDSPIKRLVLGNTPESPLWSAALKAEPLDIIVRRDSQDIAALLYTSGTTGRSKGAMLSHGNLFSNAQSLHKLWGFVPDDVLIHALPIFHVHGLFVALHTMFLNGSTTIFLPGFSAEVVIELMPRATMLMGVPTFYTRLLKESAFTFKVASNMRLFISGSAPLLAETHVEFESRTGHKILERYGMTEAGMITSNPLDGDRIAGTVGFPLPGVELRVCGDDDNVVAAGEPGVVQIRGPNVFEGYWRNPEKTAEEFRAGRWFVTGDIGISDVEGRLTIVGRAKDLIISGGFNIYPKEIEEVIDALPDVDESAVIGIPHPDLGEAVVAVVTCKSGKIISETAILDAIGNSLARYKQPRRVLVVDTLPRNTMGKVQKAGLRSSYADIMKK